MLGPVSDSQGSKTDAGAGSQPPRCIFLRVSCRVCRETRQLLQGLRLRAEVKRGKVILCFSCPEEAEHSN